MQGRGDQRQLGPLGSQIWGTGAQRCQTSPLFLPWLDQICQPDGFEPGAALFELGFAYGICRRDDQYPRSRESAPDMAGEAEL